LTVFFKKRVKQLESGAKNRFFTDKTDLTNVILQNYLKMEVQRLEKPHKNTNGNKSVKNCSHSSGASELAGGVRLRLLWLANS
jgi:hypothetical protein